MPTIDVRDANNNIVTVARVPGTGPQLATDSLPVVQPDDVTLAGPASQSVLNTDLLSGAVSGWYDAKSFNVASVMIVGGAGISAGAIIFEQTNDLTAAASGVPLRAVEVSVVNANPNVAAITIAASTVRMFKAQVDARYIRVRISTAFVGGTVQAIATLSKQTAAYSVVNVQQATAGNLNATVSGTLTGVTTLTGGPTAEDAATTSNPLITGGFVRTAAAPATLVAGDAARHTMTSAGALTIAIGAPVSSAEVASAARTATGNSGTISVPTGGAIAGHIIVSAASGTTPTLDITLEESYDNGTTWVQIWAAPRFTASGNTPIPAMEVYAVRRWVWTLTGTSPSFTFAINTTQVAHDAALIRKLFDRTANVLNGTISTPTAALYIAGCLELVAKITITTAATPATYQLQLSDDNVNWTNVGTATVAVVNSTIALIMPSGLLADYARVIVTSAGTTQVGTVVSIQAVG
jgi:hypothetical protein